MQDFQAFRDKKILITGGLGFIGSNLARRLVAPGAELTLVDSLIPSYGGNLFSLAGQTSHLDSMTSPQDDLDIDAGAQLSILEACRKHNPDVKIVFASTRQLYGKPEYLPVYEAHFVEAIKRRPIGGTGYASLQVDG